MIIDDDKDYDENDNADDNDDDKINTSGVTFQSCFVCIIIYDDRILMTMMTRLTPAILLFNHTL